MDDQPPDKIDQDEIKRRIVAALQRRRDRRRPGELPRPLPAIAIARAFGIRPRGSRDSRKRGVRLLVEQMRADGLPVLPSGGGYYLGTEPADYKAAAEFARRSGLSDLALAATIKHHPETAEASGQLGLFADDARPRRGRRSALLPGQD